MVNVPFTRPEILDLIKQDHDEVRSQFDQFSNAYQSDRQRASTISKEICDALELHTQLEEQIVYPRLKEVNANQFYEAEEEHHVADMVIKEVQQMRPDDPSFQAKMMVLRENVTHHMEEEEGEMFESIRQLPEQTLDQMANAWRTQKQQSQQRRAA